MIKTKILATVGPACSNQKAITALIENGVDVFRMNFSHGDLNEHASMLKAINQARDSFSHSIGVIGDLCGPKIRVGKIDPPQELAEGDEVIISDSNNARTIHNFTTNYPDLINDLEVGQRILINDGVISLGVSRKENDKLVCQVLVGGLLSSKKGINLPDTKVSSPAITDRDWQCADWAIENNLDYLALSFVRSADEINHLKDHIKKAGSSIKVISKLEKPEAIDNLEEIIHASDAVMVARGDLGVEMDFAEVPLIQKRVTSLCRRLGKPVIIATQMLQSMIDNPTATRAEASDIANAIMDFTDAVMLSGETAVGKYPLEAVRTICRIAKVTEKYLDESNEPRPKIETDEEFAAQAALARNVAHLIDDIKSKLVVVWTESAQSVQLLSKSRIDVPIIAFCSDQNLCRQMSLHYGVIALCKPRPDDLDAFIKMVNTEVLEKNWAGISDQILILPGNDILEDETSKALLIHSLKA
jgi:pyruvate kinase